MITSLHPSGISNFKKLSDLEWNLSCTHPFHWAYRDQMKEMEFLHPDVDNVSVHIPCSVQQSMINAGIAEDWNIGDNSRKLEWMENRHWIFSTGIPDDWIITERSSRIRCAGLDGSGSLWLNGHEVGRFENAFTEHCFDISSFLLPANNTLSIVFECPPPYAGQVARTSEISPVKPRFYYVWDWIPRMVQTGIWKEIYLEYPESTEIVDLWCHSSLAADLSDGSLDLSATMRGRTRGYSARIELFDNTGRQILELETGLDKLKTGVRAEHLKVDPWWPNLEGEHNLYTLRCVLLDPGNRPVQVIERKTGFKSVKWERCRPSPAEADPWLCRINGKEVFLQGVNWTPIRPNFADLRKEDYEKRIRAYQDMGFNLIRIWGGGFPEMDWLYNLCDEAGILIWQDFPLSSSGIESYPPSRPADLEKMKTIVRSYIANRHNHASLLLWCGGNELYNREGTLPVEEGHPMIDMMATLVSKLDPHRRFLPASPSGKALFLDEQNFGKGTQWDVHGPWWLPVEPRNGDYSGISDFWRSSDALFCSEVGVPGALSPDLIQKYKGEHDPLPVSLDNPLWRKVSFWIEADRFRDAFNGRIPDSISAYVAWSQERQVRGLTIALRETRKRFPACGGFIIWMGHDSFPCMANTSLIDFDGNKKPVADELRKMLREEI